ncbi:unannotated protein [freshwater metagenome]|uniref:Unannotated protein n=1 Tax=freshwater metagenome TaxID=449393 RepID=A0A6J5YXI5_9ZZZZ
MVTQFVLLGLLFVVPRLPDGMIPGLAYLFGKALFYVGLMVVILGFRSLGPSLTANPVPLEKATFVNTGIYRWVRHPIYLGLLTLAFGMALSQWSWPRLAVWLLLVALLTYKMQWEEQLLIKKYAAYANYMKTVPGLLPRRPDNSLPPIQ